MEVLRSPGAATGAGGAPAAAAAAEAGSVRLQFGGRQLLGGCVAWDRASGLLAVELQPASSSGGSSSNSHSSSDGTAASVAIIDPQASETHFVAHVPAGGGGAAGEGLAALLWSPAACRRLLLAVTASGAAYSWTMEDPAAAPLRPPGENGGGSGDSGGGGSSQVACINRWYGRLAFQLPLPQPQPEQPPPPVAAAAAAAAQEDAGWRRPPRRLLCCRFLEGPSAAAPWDAAGAPPCADRPLSAAQIAAHYEQRGLEQAFALADAAPAGGGAAPPSPGRPPLPLHWLRPGLLCFAAVTCTGQLLLACSARGMGGAGWALAPAVALPLPPPPPSALSAEGFDLGGGAVQQPQQLLLMADVTPASSGGLLVAASAAAPAAAGSAPPPAQKPQPQPQQLLLFEVAGPPPPLLAAAGGGQQQQQVARLSFPQSAVAPGAATLALAFLPGADGGGGSRLLVASSTGGDGGGTTACLFTCVGSARCILGLHTWQLQAGPSERLSPMQLPAAAAAAAPIGGSLALLLPGPDQLLCLLASSGGSGGSSSLVHSRPPAPAPLPRAAVGPSLAATSSAAAPGLAVSPNTLFAAVASPGSSALLLLPLVQLPGGADQVEPFMLELGKRCCASLVAGTSAGGASWDLCAAVAAACRRWGHRGLQATQGFVDGAVEAVRQDARLQYAAAWSRLKCALLAAAAAAHPAAAADVNAAAVRADAAAREWMAVAADIFEQHLSDRAVRAATNAKGAAGGSAEVRSGVLRALPARYWALWAADFSCYLTRCLLYWIKLKQQAARGAPFAKPNPTAARGEGSEEAEAAAAAFTAEQNASADCLPCIRLISEHQFYRSFSRLVASLHHFHRMLTAFTACTPQRSKQPSNLALIMQQLELLQDMIVLLRALRDAYGKAQKEGAAAAEGGAGAAASRAASLGGAWTLVCGQFSWPVSWNQAAGALQALKQHQAGGSRLLDRVRTHWNSQPEGSQGDSVASLLEAAAQLGLLPPQPPAGGVARLVQRRQVVLAAAEVGEALCGAPLPAPLPPMPGSPLASDLHHTPLPGDAGGGNTFHQRRQRVQQQAGQGRRRRERAWERERGSALGLPVAIEDDLFAFEGSVDVLTGRPLSWESGACFAAADGSVATAELQPEALAAGSSLRWQAAYAGAAPVGGQRWKRLRSG